KAAGATAFTVGDDLGGGYFAKRLKGIAKVVVVAAPRQVPHIDIHFNQSWYVSCHTTEKNRPDQLMTPNQDQREATLVAQRRVYPTFRTWDTGTSQLIANCGKT